MSNQNECTCQTCFQIIQNGEGRFVWCGFTFCLPCRESNDMDRFQRKFLAEEIQKNKLVDDNNKVKL